MNYTENFHLPQWDEHDRIMRVDFNNAMAEIEEGLTSGRNDSTELRARGWDRLCRLAYNHYCAVQDMAPAPHQIGIFHQDPAKNLTGVSGTRPWDGLCFAGKSEVTLTADVLAAGFTKITPLSMTKGNLAASQPMTGTLKLPASGRLRRFNLTGNFFDNVPNTPARFQISLTNQETGAVEQTMELNLSIDTASGSYSYRPVDISLYVLGGVEYLMTLRPLEAVYSANNVWINFETYGLADTYTNTGTVTAAHTLRELAGGEQSVVILRCMIAGNGGALTFTWDGKERQPNARRLVKTKDGRIVQEFIYYREDVIPENSQISFRFTCNAGGSFVFCDWGATLL